MPILNEVGDVEIFLRIAVAVFGGTFLLLVICFVVMFVGGLVGSAFDSDDSET